MICSLKAIFLPSENIVAREIEGELIIVPLVAGIGDMEDELFTLNETGKALWRRLDGEKTLSNIVDELIKEYEAPREEIEKDVLGLASELVRRNMLTVCA